LLYLYSLLIPSSKGVRMDLHPLEELYKLVNGDEEAISLEALLRLLNEGHLIVDFTRGLCVNVRLSNGVIIKNVELPLDLTSERGRMDAFRLVQAMIAHFKDLSSIERSVLYLLARRLGVMLPKLPINSYKRRGKDNVEVFADEIVIEV